MRLKPRALQPYISLKQTPRSPKPQTRLKPSTLNFTNPEPCPKPSDLARLFAEVLCGAFSRLSTVSPSVSPEAATF